MGVLSFRGGGEEGMTTNGPRAHPRHGFRVPEGVDGLAVDGAGFGPGMGMSVGPISSTTFRKLQGLGFRVV